MNKAERMPRSLSGCKSLDLFMDDAGILEEQPGQGELPRHNQQRPPQKEWGGGSLTPPPQSLLPCSYVVTKDRSCPALLLSPGMKASVTAASTLMLSSR